MTIKASTSIKRDGDSWYVDDPSAVQSASHSADSDKAPMPDIHIVQFDADGYDKDGYDKEGFDRNEYDREGRPKYPF
jgi:hypothetical protein